MLRRRFDDVCSSLMGTFDNTRRGNAHKAKTFADRIPRMSAIKRFGCEIARKRSVEVNGLRLNFLEWGMSGRPVLCFLHGGSAHAHWFDLVAPAFVDRFHVIALDQRGHGESDWAEPPAYATENFAADLLGVIDALGGRRIALIGHSMGGHNAMRSEEHTSELQSRGHLVCRLLLEKKK